MLNISSWSRFSLPFTITFITASIIPYLRKKAQLLLDFFDKLRRGPSAPAFGLAAGGAKGPPASQTPPPPRRQRFSLPRQPIPRPPQMDAPSREKSALGFRNLGRFRQLPYMDSVYFVTAAFTAARSCWSGWPRAWSKFSSMAVRRGLSGMAS